MAAPAPASPGVIPPASAEPVAATAQPPQSETPPVETAPAAETAKGPIPFDRHEKILANTRAKTTEEVTQQFQQQYGPHVELGNRFNADPVGTVVGLFRGLSQHPEHKQAVISELARMLGAQRGQQAQPDQEPQADFQLPDGTPFYSAPQQAKREAWLRQQMEASIDQRLQPLQAREQQRLAVEKRDEAWKAANERMSKALEPVKQMLGDDFEKHKPILREKQAEFVAQGFDSGTALGYALSHVLRDVVMPSRAAQSQQQLVADAVRKSTGSTSAPGTAAAAPAGRPKDFHQGFSRIAM